MRPISFRATGCLAGLAAISGSAFADDRIDEITIVASTPLSLLSADQTANGQGIDGDAMRRQRALDLTELMNRNLGSVFINEAQSNPLQPDVQYRGFVGSPLLGLPQGIAVYQDGVRINEPFGDTVNWALVPNAAVHSLQLQPGSDPLFGLNALGGAISIRTKDGFTHEGTRAEAFLGSYSRFGSTIETGGTFTDNLAYFGSVSYLEEDGWRDFSQTRATQAFGSLRWQGARSAVEAKLTLVDTKLTGNGAAPVQLLEIDRAAVFTHPDDTDNDLAMLNVVASHDFSGLVSLTGNAYVRQSDIATLNGDDSDYEECENDPGFLCIDDEPAFALDGSPIPADETLESATVNRTKTRQDGSGFSLQLDIDSLFDARNDHLLVGMTYDRSSVDFGAGTELGMLDDTRGAIGGEVFVADAVTQLETESRIGSFFFAYGLGLGERLRANFAARYNRVELQLRDQLGTALDGDHDFDRLNPSLGLTYSMPEATFYGRYSESSRVPSPVELTCADEDDPCRLPNAFLADPPLDMVVAKTWEAGVRGGNSRFGWHAGVFQTDNEDDIIFISSGALTSEGYFDNVGRTRRVGMELNVEGRLLESLSWFAHYTWLEATFENAFTVSSPRNPSAVDDEIDVRPGDRLPLVPGHLFKGGINWEPSDRFTVGLDVQASSDQYLRGDEGNDEETVSGYSVLNMNASYRFGEHVRVFASINNVLDTEYETFGLFGEADEVLGDQYDNNRFLSPGSPRGAWVGIELTTD